MKNRKRVKESIKGEEIKEEKGQRRKAKEEK
jgi:hypothetical protein